MKRLITFLLVLTMCMSGTLVYATDATSADDAYGTAITDCAADNENVLVIGDPANGDRANSWRYSDGQLIEVPELYNSGETGGTESQLTEPNMTLHGIDVSKHQGKIDWEKVKASGKVDFVIIRCSYGLDRTQWDDEWFEYNASECERLGIPYGVYHYSYAETVAEAESEALHVLRMIEGHTLSYPVFYDLEDQMVLVGSNKTQKRANLAAFAKTFCSIIEDEGYVAGVYANLYWWNTYLTDSCFDQWHRWVARYENPYCGYSKSYGMWQYTSSGSVDGISGRVDMNYQIGNPADFGVPQQVQQDPAVTANLERLFASSNTLRAAGKDRFATAMEAARLLKKGQGISKFDNIIVASGNDYPDALTGSYLAKVKDAPILLVNKSNESSMASYIKSNLNEGGSVYILGGTGVVSQNFETKLKNTLATGTTVKRLAGKDRYATNIAILKEAGVTNEDLLICTGSGFADSLSASAVGKPIMLVGSGFTSAQKSYLNSLKTEKIYIIGGTGVVSTSVENACKTYGFTTRIAGSDRYKTSQAVAWRFFRYSSDAAVLAYGLNFPDGLTGGPLAMSIDAPLLLVDNSHYSAARSYIKSTGIKNVVTMGGSALISDKTVRTILN